MTVYDQFFKNLLQHFFGDFLHLVAPEVVSRLHLERARFLDKQSFTDLPQGERREMDLLAEVPIVGGGPPLLVHVEIEAQARRGMKKRLWSYYMQLRLRHDLTVMPILVNLKGGPPGLTFVTLEEGIPGLETAIFRHRCFGLSGCLAEEYLLRPEPLAWALAALMRSERWNRVEKKLECLRRIASAVGLTEVQNFLLANCVETYLELDEREAAAYAVVREAGGYQEVSAMEMTWADRIEEKGRRKGLEEGLRSLRGVVLRLLGQRFGPLPESVRRRVEAIDSMEPLTRIAGEVLVVRSLDEVVL